MMTAGLIGTHVSGSLTPALHEGEARALGIAYRYDPMDLADKSFRGLSLQSALDQAEANAYVGVNITHPFKTKVLDFLDTTSAEAEQLGAVNTVVFHSGRREGHNTDYLGFLSSFQRESTSWPIEDVLLVGAGGAGRAVGLALLDAGVKRLWLFDRDTEMTKSVANMLGTLRPQASVQFWQPGHPIDGLVNATPMGMASHPGVAVSLADSGVRHWVSDIVYFPFMTRLLNEAKVRGLKILTGGGMAVFQAARSFELFTGRTPDVARMTTAFQQMTSEASV